MTNLFIFIVGIIFVLLVIPILQSIADLICSACEVLKAKMSIVITECNVKMQNLNDSIQPCNTNVIGFKAPEMVEEEFYDTEDKLTSRKVGF